MSIITYLDIRDEAIKQIRETLANPKIYIDAHPGDFDEKEIRRLAVRTPAILTSIVRISDDDSADESWIDFATWILYRANNQDKLYDGAVRMVSAIIPIIRGLNAEWSYDGATKIIAECLYTSSLDGLNITLWGVRWRWPVRGAVITPEFPGEGGILLPDDLDYFEGYEADTLVGDQLVKDSVDLEV